MGSAAPDDPPAGSLVILLGGPSGSGKSRLATRLGLPTVALDDFYRDAVDPAVPKVDGVVDWESPTSWNADAAVDALRRLCREGRAVLPRYEHGLDRRVGEHVVDLHGATFVVAEGLFAAEIAPALRASGHLAAAIAVLSPRRRTFVRRLRRDLAARRKPPTQILRIGLRKLRSEHAVLAHLDAAGFERLTAAEAEHRLRRLIAAG